MSDITILVVNFDVVWDVFCSVTDAVCVVFIVVGTSVCLYAVVLVCNFDKSIDVCCISLDDVSPVVDCVIMSVVCENVFPGDDSSVVVWRNDECFVVASFVVVIAEDGGTIVVGDEVEVSSHVASHGKQRTGVFIIVSLVP